MWSEISLVEYDNADLEVGTDRHERAVTLLAGGGRDLPTAAVSRRNPGAGMVGAFAGPLRGDR